MGINKCAAHKASKSLRLIWYSILRDRKTWKTENCFQTRAQQLRRSKVEEEKKLDIISFLLRINFLNEHKAKTKWNQLAQNNVIKLIKKCLAEERVLYVEIYDWCMVKILLNYFNDWKRLRHIWRLYPLRPFATTAPQYMLHSTSIQWTMPGPDWLPVVGRV